MKRRFLILAGVLVTGGLLFLVFGPEGKAPSPVSNPAPGAAASSGGSLRPSDGPGGNAARPVSPPGSKPIPEELADPRALSPKPLPLNLGGPPFERQDDGRIFKKDVMATANDLNGEDHEAVTDLEILGSLVNSYRSIFKENPIAGENREVVEALTGKNLYNLVLIDPSHPAIDPNGELVDRWQTPYRFHPLSRNRMEIFSAGEDRQFGTGDDITIDDPTVIGDRGVGR